MPIEGIKLTINNVSGGDIDITDIPDVTDAQPGFQVPGPVTVPTGGSIDLFFTGAVAKSYGLGDIRTYIDSTDFTVSFTLDTNFQDAVDLPKINGIHTVAPEGATFTSIQAAMDIAASGETVLIYPGTYAESITTAGIQPDVCVEGFPSKKDVILAGVDTTSTRVTIEKDFSLKNITIKAPSSGGNPAIDTTGLGVGEICPLVDISIVGQGGTGPAFSGCGSGVVVPLVGISHDGGTLGSFIESSSGVMIAGDLIANSGTSTSFINISGGVCEIRGISFQDSLSYTTTYALEISGGSLQLLSLGIPENNSPATNGLFISGDGITLDLSNCHIHSNTNDILVDSGLTGVGNFFTFNAVEFKQESFTNLSGTTWINNTVWTGFHVDTGVEDDPGTKFIGELHVGKPLSPSESCFGTGDSTTLGMYVYTDDGTGTNFIDVTAAAKSISGSTFTLQGTGANAATLYVGSTLRPFSDIKVNQTVLANLGTGNFIVEIWTGATWEELYFVVRDTVYPRTQRARKAFTGMFNRIRLDVDSTTYSNWATNDPGMGQTAYWARVRNPNAITSVPTIERIKTGFERFQINSDGTTENVGIAGRNVTWWIGTGELLSAPSGGANASGNLDVTISTNVTYQQAKSSYATGQDNRAGTQIAIPVGLDTSRVVLMKIRWITNGTSTNAVRWDLYVTVVQEGDTLNVDTSELAVITQTVAPTGTIDKEITTEFSVRIPDVVPGESIGFSLWRKGTVDTNPNAAGVLTIEWRGKFLD